jgi:hypothetical protein
VHNAPLDHTLRDFCCSQGSPLWGVLFVSSPFARFHEGGRKPNQISFSFFMTRPASITSSFSAVASNRHLTPFVRRNSNSYPPLSQTYSNGRLKKKTRWVAITLSPPATFTRISPSVIHISLMGMSSNKLSEPFVAPFRPISCSRGLPCLNPLPLTELATLSST